MITKNEKIQDLSAKDMGKKSRYYIRRDVKTKPCVTTTPADPAKLAAYKAAHPEEFTPETIKLKKKNFRTKLYTDDRICGV